MFEQPTQMASSSSSSTDGGFSIREYTAGMRSTDITKCLPFGGFTADKPESFLPPIRVVKFRWWLDVLSSARSRKEIDVSDLISLGSIVRRRSGLHSARADHDDCTVEEESEVGELSRTKKKKKERSILEIFAVSPRVITRGTRRKKKKKGVLAKMKTRVSETKKVLCSNTRERSSATRIDEESNLKLEQKIPPEKHKCSKLWPNFDAKCQKPASSENPVRGILKRRSQYSSGRGSEIGPDEFRSLVKSHDIGEKRVKFTISVRDDELRSDEKSSNSMEVIAEAVAINDYSSAPKRNRSDCEAVIDVEDSPDSSVDENSSELVKTSDNKPEDSDFRKEFGVRSQIMTGLDEPLHALNKRTTVTFHGPQYADYSKYLHEIASPISARVNDHIDTSILTYDHHPSFHRPIYSPHQAAMTKTVSGISPAKLAPIGCTNQGPISFLYGSDLTGASSHPSAYHHPLRLMHSPNLRGSSYASHGDGFTDKDLLGLPLNSHGELVRLNSGGGHMLRDCHSFPMKGPRDDFRLRMTMSGIASDQSDSFRTLDLGEKGPCSFHVARSHVRTEVDYCWPKYWEEGSLRGKGVGYDRASPSSTPLTMRLMGKDVPVSRSSRDTNGSEYGSIWTDKAVIMEHRPSIIENCFLHNQVSQQWVMQSDSAIIKEAERRCSNPYFVWHNGEASTQRFSHHEQPNFSYPSPMASPSFGSPNVSFNSNTHRKCHPIRREPVGFGSMQNTRPWISSGFLCPEVKEYSQPSQLPIISSSLAQFPHPITPEHRRVPSFQSTNAIPSWISVSPASDLGKTSSFYYQPYLDTSMRPNFLSQRENSSILSSAGPPYMPVLPRVGPNAAQRPSCSNSYHVNSRDSMRWNPSEIPIYDPFRNSGQKPPASLVYPKKHLRPFNLQPRFCADSSCSGSTSASVEIDFGRETGSWGKYVGPQIKNLGPKMSRVCSSTEQDKGKEAANLDPMKLTAGAKHILKTSFDTNKASSVPVHSTIPFAGVTGFVVDPECDGRWSKTFKL